MIRMGRFVITRDGLQPFDAAARDLLANVPNGEPITLEALYERDMIEHRRIMATIGDVAKALRTTPEKVRAELLVATGNFTLLGDVLGMPVVAVSSMSRRSMKDHELHEFWEEAQEIIRTTLLARVADAAEQTRLAELLSLQIA
ncbi:hypothetical protein WDM22_38655 [Bradyrhizobium septentrionale]|uniref:hypothetical protein n=1 Tax=Bradyrhizobium septentrionale TaxID=1404411 RepID=UPI0030D3905A